MITIIRPWFPGDPLPLGAVTLDEPPAASLPAGEDPAEVEPVTTADPEPDPEAAWQALRDAGLSEPELRERAGGR